MAQFHIVRFHMVQFHIAQFHIVQFHLVEFSPSMIFTYHNFALASSRHTQAQDVLKLQGSIFKLRGTYSSSGCTQSEGHTQAEGRTQAKWAL